VLSMSAEGSRDQQPRALMRAVRQQQEDQPTQVLLRWQQDPTLPNWSRRRTCGSAVAAGAPRVAARQPRPRQRMRRRPRRALQQRPKQAARRSRQRRWHLRARSSTWGPCPGAPVHSGPWQHEAAPALPCKHALCAGTRALAAHAAASNGGWTAGRGQGTATGLERRRLAIEPGATCEPPAARPAGAAARPGLHTLYHIHTLYPLAGAHPQLAQAEQIAALRDADGGAHGRAQQRLPRHRQQQLHARHVHKRLRAGRARCDALAAGAAALASLPALQGGAAPALTPPPGAHTLQACNGKDGLASHTQELHLIWNYLHILPQWCMKCYAALALGLSTCCTPCWQRGLTGSQEHPGCCAKKCLD